MRKYSGRSKIVSELASGEAIELWFGGDIA